MTSKHEIDEVIDGSQESSAIEKLRKLLNDVVANWRALAILDALDGGDKNKAAEIALRARGEGVDPDRLKAACRMLKGAKKIQST